MIYWLVSLAAIVGVVLNIFRHAGCFYIWSVTNAVWAYADLTHGLPAQAALQLVYFALSIYGIYKWSGRRQQPHAEKDPT